MGDAAPNKNVGIEEVKMSIKAFAVSVVAGLAVGGGIGVAVGGIEVTPKVGSPVVVHRAVAPKMVFPKPVSARRGSLFFKHCSLIATSESYPIGHPCR